MNTNGKFVTINDRISSNWLVDWNAIQLHEILVLSLSMRQSRCWASFSDKSLGIRRQYTPGQRNVSVTPLVDPNRVLPPPLLQIRYSRIDVR